MTFLLLTAEQRKALQESSGLPVFILDRAESRKYVLMHETAYNAMLAALRERDPDTAAFLESNSWS